MPVISPFCSEPPAPSLSAADPAAFLGACPVIETTSPAVIALARKLAADCPTPRAVIDACFLFVRDRIAHTLDQQGGPVTCSATSVLRDGSGLCYPKSHLLAALLRANGLPAGLCYQRLRLDGPESPFCLHGLNAVWLPPFGWVRLDARGNKPGVAARFDPPGEVLAFALEHPGERLLPGLYATPLPVVVETLQAAPDWRWLVDHLPDCGDAGALASAPLMAS